MIRSDPPAAFDLTLGRTSFCHRPQAEGHIRWQMRVASSVGEKYEFGVVRCHIVSTRRSVSYDRSGSQACQMEELGEESWQCSVGSRQEDPLRA